MNDPFRQRPRISLIGTIVDVEVDGREVKRLRVEIKPRTLALLRRNPIVRTDETTPLFEACGIVRGSIATFYRVDADTWRRFLTLAGLA